MHLGFVFCILRSNSKWLGNQRNFLITLYNKFSNIYVIYSRFLAQLVTGVLMQHRGWISTVMLEIQNSCAESELTVCEAVCISRLTPTAFKRTSVQCTTFKFSEFIS